MRTFVALAIVVGALLAIAAPANAAGDCEPIYGPTGDWLPVTVWTGTVSCETAQAAASTFLPEDGAGEQSFDLGGYSWSCEDALNDDLDAGIVGSCDGTAPGVFDAKVYILAAEVTKTQDITPPVYFRWNKNGDDSRRPGRINVIIDELLVNLHWSKWRDSGAIGRGNMVFFLREANGKGGTKTRWSPKSPVSIRLSRARDCDDGTRIYTRMAVRVKKRHYRYHRGFTLRLSCEG